MQSVDEKSQKMIEEMYDMVKKDHDILKRMRRSQRNAQFLRLLYWLVIIAISVGGYYFFSPYLKKITSVYNSIYNDSSVLQHLDTSQIRDFLNGNTTK